MPKFPFPRLRSILHFATGRNQSPAARDTVTARVQVPPANRVRVSDLDGPTVWIPRTGAALNTGRYQPRRRTDDRNAMPRTFAGQRVIA